ncbi:MAG: 1-acyl-sn-glycerol-3-phosphate acyltransferase [Firmicutes bacterium]|nr:1-acyl-sn-glycerol-3-phosphate acyltransferase [Bacillota bacterium]
MFLIYKICAKIIKLYLGIFKQLKISGQENIPSEGPVIIVANHISAWDPPVVAVACPRQVHFMAKHELFTNPLLRWVFTKLGAFPVKRHVPDRKAYKYALTILRDNRVLGMFPEGTRSKSGELNPAEQGAALLALRTQATLIPAGIKGTRYKDTGPVQIRFGQQVPWSDLDPKDRASNRVLAERIMHHIARLLTD